MSSDLRFVCLYVLICICGFQGFVGCTFQLYWSQDLEGLDWASTARKRVPMFLCSRENNWFQKSMGFFGSNDNNDIINNSNNNNNDDNNENNDCNFTTAVVVNLHVEKKTLGHSKRCCQNTHFSSCPIKNI